MNGLKGGVGGHGRGTSLGEETPRRTAPKMRKSVRRVQKHRSTAECVMWHHRPDLTIQATFAISGSTTYCNSEVVCGDHDKETTK